MPQDKKGFWKNRILSLADEFFAAIIIFIIGVLITKGRSVIIKFLEDTKGIAITATIFSVVLFVVAVILIWRKKTSLVPKKFRRPWDIQIRIQGRQRNPFIVGAPVFGKNFFNRKSEIEQIYDYLGRRESCSIVSNRRIGKTSILHHISHESTIQSIGRNFGIDPGKDVFIYFDMATFEDEAQFWKGLCFKLSETTSIPLKNPTMKNLDFDAFCKCLGQIKKRGLQLKLLFDEFDVTANRMEEPFFARLRSLPGQFDIAYIMTTIKHLQEYVELGQMQSSPFPNIFREVKLGLFSEEESRKLLSTLSSEAYLAFTDEDIGFLIDLAGPHPYFLQMAGEVLFNLYVSPNKNGRIHKGYIRNEAWERFYKLAFNHFNYYFNKLEPEEQKALVGLVRKRKTALKPELASVLESRVLIRKAGSEYIPFSDAFKEFIISEKLPKSRNTKPTGKNKKVNEVPSS